MISEISNLTFPQPTPHFPTKFYFSELPSLLRNNCNSPGSEFKTLRGSSLVAQQAKDLALSPQQLGSPLWRGFSPWPGNFHKLQVQPKNKTKQKKKTNKSKPLGIILHACLYSHPLPKHPQILSASPGKMYPEFSHLCPPCLFQLLPSLP